MFVPTLLILLSGCAPEPVAACVLTEADATESCPVATCSIGCASVEEGLRCCRQTYGYGLDGDALPVLDDTCEAGPACDPNLYLTHAAAMCAAQVHGLPTGVERCDAGFEHGASSGYTWRALSITADGCVDGGETADKDGVWLSMDATTGLGVDYGGMVLSVVCL
ncbi:MAG: hypothetical protein V4850_04835 [Myxococcota bacterium]